MATPNTVAADTLRLWNFLPAFVRSQDAAGGYAFLTWLDGSIKNLQTIDDLCRDQMGAPGWSQLLDVSRCPTYALPWLGQFLGVRLPVGQFTDAQMRAQIINPAGWQRGSLGSIEAAAMPYMQSGSVVTVLERDPDPYTITVQVPSAGLQGLDYQELDAKYTPYSVLDSAFADYDDFTQNSAGVIAAIFNAIPAGIRVIINFI